MTGVTTRSRVLPVAILTTFAAFMFVSLQIRGVGELVARGASPIAVAGSTQLLQGLVTLGVIGLVPALRAGVRRAVTGVRSGDIPLWTLAGGLAGAFAHVAVIAEDLEVGLF